MTWILIVVTSVTVWASPHPSLEVCRAEFKKAMVGTPALYHGEMQHAYCIAASGTDVHWRSADYPH